MVGGLLPIAVSLPTHVELGLGCTNIETRLNLISPKVELYQQRCYFPPRTRSSEKNVRTDREEKKKITVNSGHFVPLAACL